MGTIKIIVLSLVVVVLALSSTTTVSRLTLAAGQSGADGLSGTSWQLVKFQDNSGLMVVQDRSKYTITFGSDGRVSARVDCNRGGSTWKSVGASRLQFGSWQMTRAKCSSGSLHDRIVREGGAVRNYQLKDGHLFLSGMEEGGFYELEPLTAPKRRS